MILISHSCLTGNKINSFCIHISSRIWRIWSFVSIWLFCSFLSTSSFLVAWGRCRPSRQWESVFQPLHHRPRPCQALLGIPSDHKPNPSSPEKSFPVICRGCQRPIGFVVDKRLDLSGGTWPRCWNWSSCVLTCSIGRRTFANSGKIRLPLDGWPTRDMWYRSGLIHWDRGLCQAPVLYFCLLLKAGRWKDLRWSLA